MEIRLQKVLAQAGLASRRKAEELILAGRVEVNSQIVRELGTKVDPARDLIRVDGKLLRERERRVYFVLYKPAGMVTTLSDPQGRPTIKDCLKGIEERVFAVGRLDWDAEGALLVTNDGELANHLMHPRYQVPRTYLAKVKGDPDAATLNKLREGVRLEDGMIKPDRVEVERETDKNTWLRLVVSEGRSHLVKRLCAAVGHPVVRLFRPQYAGIGVEGLRPGEFRLLTAPEVEQLRHAGPIASAEAVPLRMPARRHRKGPKPVKKASLAPAASEVMDGGSIDRGERPGHGARGGQGEPRDERTGYGARGGQGEGKSPGRGASAGRDDRAGFHSRGGQGDRRDERTGYGARGGQGEPRGRGGSSGRDDRAGFHSRGGQGDRRDERTGYGARGGEGKSPGRGASTGRADRTGPGARGGQGDRSGPADRGGSDRRRRGPGRR